MSTVNIAQGARKIEWARAHMPLMAMLASELAATKPLAGLTVAASIHLEAKTAVMAQTLASAGAEVRATGCNPLSTQDDVAAALAETPNIKVFAKRGVTETEYHDDLHKTLNGGVDAFIDDGGDLCALLHGPLANLQKRVKGGTEETTTGVRRLRALHAQKKLNLPMTAVNDAQMKYLFDNRYGTGQSVWDGIMRTTNLTVAGKTVVIAGYGWCGRGVAMRASGMGARVIVTEIDPVRAIEAMMDGFSTLPMSKAVYKGDIFVTVTGCRDVLTPEHFRRMKDGAILCNAGHFDVEVDVAGLRSMATDVQKVRENIECYTQKNGQKLYLLGEGRLVNLACADGHPAEVMDVSFALQTLSILEIVAKDKRKPGLYPVDPGIDRQIAQMRLQTMGGEVDMLTEKQAAYYNGE